MGALRGLESQLGSLARAMACFLARGELVRPKMGRVGVGKAWNYLWPNWLGSLRVSL